LPEHFSSRVVEIGYLPAGKNTLPVCPDVHEKSIAAWRYVTRSVVLVLA
jgi:hypothetical protein